jgi:Terminase large subunit, T4likevirus-type, N-terminal
MLTRQEILTEFGKCLDSPIYAIETYLETFDMTREGFVPFLLFPRQKEIIFAYENHRFNLVTKPRQAGVSTTTAGYLSVKLGTASEKNPENVLIIANKQDLAFEFLKKIKSFLSQLPRWMWGPDYYGTPKNNAKTIFSVDAKGELLLPNGCRVKAVATNEDALRGFTPTYLVMDEAAYIDKGDTVWGAALTALGTGGRAMLISTPNGMDKLYYETYIQAKSGDNNFNVVEMKWYEDLRYNKDLRWVRGDEVIEETEFTFESYGEKILTGYKPTSTWYEQMCMGMNNNPRMIAQELDVSFIGSGDNVIAEADIQYQEKFNVKKPKYIKGVQGETWIWEEPIEGHQYVLGSDVSRGDGEDSSTIVILDFTVMEQVFEYVGKIQPDLLALLIEEWGEKYKAYSVVDITGGMGVATVLKLLEFDYKRLHYDTPNGKILSSKQKQIEAYRKDNKVPGLQVSSIRLQMISNFEEKVRHNIVKIRSIRMINEMNKFIYKNGRPDHQDGSHDDLIMAMAMCLWVIEHSFKNLEKLEKQTKAMLSSWMSTGTINEKQSKNNKLKPKFSPIVSRNMQDPAGNYMWLFSNSK